MRSRSAQLSDAEARLSCCRGYAGSHKRLSVAPSFLCVCPRQRRRSSSCWPRSLWNVWSAPRSNTRDIRRASPLTKGVGAGRYCRFRQHRDSSASHHFRTGSDVVSASESRRTNATSGPSGPKPIARMAHIQPERSSRDAVRQIRPQHTT